MSIRKGLCNSAGTLISCAALSITVYFLFNSTREKQSIHDIEVISDNQLSSEPTTFSTGVGATPHISEFSDPNLDDVNLLELCPDLHGELSVDCLEAMDRVFQSRDLGFFANFISFPGQLTYLRVFNDPQNDRSLIFEALEREDCRLENGDFRDDLKDSCHAEAFASFGTFLQQCDLDYTERFSTKWFEPHINFGGKSLFQTEVDHIEQYSEVDPDGYRGLKNAIWTGVLESRWIEEKCSHYDMSTLLIPSSTKEFRRLEEISLKLSKISTLESGKTLTWMAARLGEGWSLGLHTFARHIHGQSVDSYDEYLERKHPWIRSLTEAQVPLNSRVKRLQEAIAAVMSIHDNGWDVDLAKLVGEVCGEPTIRRYYDEDRPKPPESQSCASAIASLNITIPSSNFRELKVLEEFGRISMELGVYDSVE